MTVEVHVGGGLPSFNIVGLPATAVRESRDRVRAALVNLGYQIPAGRITAHLGPADIPKSGSRYDLPIALGVLLASSQLRTSTDNLEFIGELSLSGALRPVPGVLPCVLSTMEAASAMVLPAECASEAALVAGAKALPADGLEQVIAHLTGLRPIDEITGVAPAGCRDSNGLSPIKGHDEAKRALLVAAAGRHNMLMVGPPGSGKTMLATRLPNLLPDLTYQQALEVAALRSVAGLPNSTTSFYEPPFRQPHHGTSAVGLIGGGSRPKPGEVSLAHHGVLFLDELAEFQRSALEALREPLESGMAHVSRIAGRASFPAEVQLIAAMNP